MKSLMKIIVMVFSLSSSLFAQGVATLTALKGDVSIQNSVEVKKATLGDALFEKDSVITQSRSKAQIIFRDETVVTIGKNSNFSIAKYMYENAENSEVEFGLIKGAMSTITGKIGKIAPQKFKVKTKTATIGIRGTNFTIVILEDGSQRVYCTFGAIVVMIGGKTYEVKQGYYLGISINMEANVEAFSSDELADMHTKNFGEEKLISNASEDGASISNRVILDTTQQIVHDEISRNQEDIMQDVVQTFVPHGLNGVDEIETPVFISLNGWSTDGDNFTSMASQANVSFVEDGSSFNPLSSYIDVLDKSNASGNGEADNWKFTIAATPSTFTSWDDFSVMISAVDLTPLASSTSVSAELVSGSLSATSDLVADDMMSWGVWNATVNFESVQSGVLLSDTHDFSGFWVSGEPTDTAVVAALTGTLLYSGQYQAYQINASVPTVETGLAALSVDFGAGQATLDIYDNTNQGGTVVGFYSYAMELIDNTISGDINIGSGSANGTFYGADAKLVGGNFLINNGSEANVKGVYQVQAP